MKEITQHEKVKMIIGAANAIAAFDVLNEDDGGEDTLKSLDGMFVEMCVMYVQEYLQVGCSDEEASEFIAKQATKALGAAKIISKGEPEIEVLKPTKEQMEKIKEILGL